MSGQRPSSPSRWPSTSSPLPSMPPLQPQPFRFWLPYRSTVGSWRQQPRPPPPPPRPMPSSPRHQPPSPPPPTPAEPAARRPAPPAAVEDIPLHGESSDESDRIPVQPLDSSQLRGARPSIADLELTLSGGPTTGQEQSSRRDDGSRGNDTKIAISGFPRSRLFDGARAPYRREIEDGLKSLAAREAPAPRPETGQGYRVITLAGHNVGASMVLGGGGGPMDAPAPRAPEPEEPGSAAARPPAVAANVNSNVQSVNNSSLEGSTCSAGNPGVHVDIKNNAREEPEPEPEPEVATAPTPTRREEDKPKEPAATRPPLAMPAAPQDKGAAARGGDEAAKPARRRRCLRALMMENGSDTEAARKPKPGPCRFQCVTDHAPPATASSGGGAGAGGNNAEEGGKSSAQEGS